MPSADAIMQTMRPWVMFTAKKPVTLASGEVFAKAGDVVYARVGRSDFFGLEVVARNKHGHVARLVLEELAANVRKNYRKVKPEVVPPVTLRERVVE